MESLSLQAQPLLPKTQCQVPPNRKLSQKQPQNRFPSAQDVLAVYYPLLKVFNSFGFGQEMCWDWSASQYLRSRFELVSLYARGLAHDGQSSETTMSGTTKVCGG